ncbi:Hypothetical protein CAP_8041 [Chondromyces apiculatus DSM 436]|uniref:Uncharacterized protein n=1 Tax=Chondromyces apiculatus DSM 436 TaxID=1192034 RepID=A0A017SX89_9BACT|nr:Hypothetical protein CAP_8041 [Chondromyces apiculatus DSM 436]
MLHVIIDTAVEPDEAKLRLLVNGEAKTVTREPWESPPSGPLTLNQGTRLVLGNLLTQDRSMRGDLYYAAIYPRALTQTQVEANVAVLKQRNDEP